MSSTLMMLTGDINLMNVTDATIPFRQIASTLNSADVLFGNLECCFYQPPAAISVMDEGFYASPAAGQALKIAGYAAIGNANNVNYGTEAISASLQALKTLGIPSTGAGLNRSGARAPVILTHNGVRYGFIQRTSVYWPTNHEALEHSPGVAALRGITAYQLPLHKTRPEIPPANRPGVPPVIVTWTDPKYLAEYPSWSFPRRLEQLGGFMHGQAHDARIAAFHVGDMRGRFALDGIGAGLAFPFSAVQIAIQFSVTPSGKPHL